MMFLPFFFTGDLAVMRIDLNSDMCEGSPLAKDGGIIISGTNTYMIDVVIGGIDTFADFGRETNLVVIESSYVDCFPHLMVL